MPATRTMPSAPSATRCEVGVSPWAPQRGRIAPISLCLPCMLLWASPRSGWAAAALIPLLEGCPVSLPLWLGAFCNAILTTPSAGSLWSLTSEPASDGSPYFGDTPARRQLVNPELCLLTRDLGYFPYTQARLGLLGGLPHSAVPHSSQGSAPAGKGLVA